MATRETSFNSPVARSVGTAPRVREGQDDRVKIEQMKIAAAEQMQKEHLKTEGTVVSRAMRAVKTVKFEKKILPWILVGIVLLIVVVICFTVEPMKGITFKLFSACDHGADACNNLCGDVDGCTKCSNSMKS
jgi:hypothetical protein